MLWQNWICAALIQADLLVQTAMMVILQRNEAEHVKIRIPKSDLRQYLSLGYFSGIRACMLSVWQNVKTSLV